jgi:hypothetical protein
MPYSTVVRTRWLLVVVVLVTACSSSTNGGGSRIIGATSVTAAPSTAVPSTAVSTVGPPTTTGVVSSSAHLPDPRLTPGLADPRVTQADIGHTICVSGYTATVRPPVSVTERIKVQAMAAYGLRDSMSNYELDHLIPLELGGAPADIRNLWPEPYETHGTGSGARGTGAETKDRVENAGRSAVCAGRLTLAAAQAGIAANWFTFGRSLGVF